MSTNSTPTYTIIQADGLYPDDTVENEIFTRNPKHEYKVNYVRVGLFPPGQAERKPWSDVPADLREQVDGIEVLKMPFTREDLELFPKLKV